MAHIEDRWYRVVAGNKVKTARHGRGARWRARLRGPEGERGKSFERRGDAERWIATQTSDVARGQWIDPALGRMTFENWVARWQRGLNDLRPTTRALNLGIVRTCSPASAAGHSPVSRPRT